jgi:hypothetical protein
VSEADHADAEHQDRAKHFDQRKTLGWTGKSHWRGN